MHFMQYVVPLRTAYNEEVTEVYPLIYWYRRRTQTKDPTAKEVSATLDSILLNYDNRLRPDIGKKPLYVQSDVFITGKIG